MIELSLTRFGRPSLLHVALCLGIPCCNTGTEGDNPVVGPIDASPCKGDAEYATYLARAVLPTLSNRSLRRDFGSVTQALVARDEMPIALECLEWAYADDELRLSVSNFAGSCHVDWVGEVRVSAPGDVVISLQNPNCAIAGCGSCAYDTRGELSAARSELLLPHTDAAHVTLELLDCDGELTRGYEWDISLADDGILCKPIESWFWLDAKASGSELFNETQLNLYAQCGDVEGAVECTEGRSCNSGYCAPACSSDADCPLDGALTCQEGVCLVKP